MKIHALPIPKFDSTIEVEMERFGKLKYKIQPAENASAMDTEWAAPITLSYMPLNDLLHLISIIMQEKKVIFFSSNFALLSATL